MRYRSGLPVMTTVPWQGRSPSHKARLFVWLLLVAALARGRPVPDRCRTTCALPRCCSESPTRMPRDGLPTTMCIPLTCAIRASTSKARPFRLAFICRAASSSAPGIVVVHGMHELGINEPRLVNFARSLAASGFFVMTPQVPGIADYRVRGRVGRSYRHGSTELRTTTPGAESGRAGAQFLWRTGAARSQ